ncbi:MAG: rhodanese-like domain-containing protein [Gemmatimonadales bacterium]
MPFRTDLLDADRPIVTYCHHGIRSLDAQRILMAAGFTNVRSLRGGIDAWSREVDGDVRTY